MAFTAKRIPNVHGTALLVRPNRLPIAHGQHVGQPRLFTQIHPLLLMTRTSSPRPQLPYLSQPSGFSRPTVAAIPRGPAFQKQIARLLTTENRSYVRQQVWLATKWTALGWSMLFLLAMAYYGWLQEMIERQHPSPQEWSYFTREAYRKAQAQLDPEFDGSGVTDWGAVGSEFRRCLERLEDASRDGKDITPIVSGQLTELVSILGVNPSSFDISNKSYPWKTGYYQVLMGCARAAEFLDDMVRDKTRRMVFPKDVVIGPSNPDPRPVPPGAAAPPLEENCDRPYAPPETFYLKVLTGLGFTTRQRLDAALAYANWLEVKGLQDAAEETYRWALDIAASAMPSPESVIDFSTGIIKVQDSALPTPNLLKAATSLATHHARTGNVQAALPIYLSVYRARRQAPVDSAAQILLSQRERDFSSHADTDYGAVWALLKKIIRKDEYPSPPPSGDDPFLRSPVNDQDCQDAELMLYIGEILFATSPSRTPEEGLGWTKNAVAIAEKTVADPKLSPEDRAVCKSCLKTGADNWASMVRKLMRDEKETAVLPTAKSWTSWFSSSEKQQKTDIGRNRWEQESKDVEALKMKLLNEGISDRLASARGAPGSVWIG